jgi:hypothetical protein
MLRRLMFRSTSSHMPVKPTSSKKSSTLLCLLSLPKRSGTNEVRIFKDSGNSPELARRALLIRVTLKATGSGQGSKTGSMA